MPLHEDQSPVPIGDLIRTAGLGSLGSDPPPEAVDAALRRFVEQLEDADQLRLVLARGEAIHVLEVAGVRSPAGVVDAAFKAARPLPSDSAAQGQPVGLHCSEPWPHPVDGAALLEELVRTFDRYIVLPPGCATASALWVLHTYAHDAAAVSPLLAVLSAQKRCGKTTFMSLLHALVNKGLLASNISPAVLYRFVESHRPTLLLDEADSFMHGDSELRNLINAGHSRSAAYVLRSVGDDHEPRSFSVWAPKAIARIGELPDTLADRSITLRLARRAPGEIVRRLRLAKIKDEVEALRRKAARWTTDHMNILRDSDPEVPDKLDDRAADNWHALFALADAAGGAWPHRAREAALLLRGAAEDDAPAVLLLRDLRDLFTTKGVDRLTSAEIIAALIGMEERPWPEWRHGRALSASGLARLLRPFSVTPRQVRIGDRTAKGYLLEHLEDVFRRYLPTESKQPKHLSRDARKEVPTNRNTPDAVSAAQPRGKPQGDLLVSTVSAPQGEATREVLEL